MSIDETVPSMMIMNKKGEQLRGVARESFGNTFVTFGCTFMMTKRSLDLEKKLDADGLHAPTAFNSASEFSTAKKIKREPHPLENDVADTQSALNTVSDVSTGSKFVAHELDDKKRETRCLDNEIDRMSKRIDEVPLTKNLNVRVVEISSTCDLENISNVYDGCEERFFGPSIFTPTLAL